jgi:perosamine synthetase
MNVTLGTYQADDETYRLVNRVLQSGRLSYGPLCHELEYNLARLHHCDYGILSNSGTSALLVALQALKETHGWKDGAEVIVPATTFVATINAVYHAKLKPVLVDVGLPDYALDPALIEQALTLDSVAILPVHPFGQPADMKVICEIAQRHKLFVVEDSCEAMFVETSGLSVGSWGSVGCFSTYVAHLLTTGVGGLCTTNDHDLALKIRSLVNHGIDVTELPSSNEYDPSHLARKFRFTSIGHSFRITELEAAIGLPQLKHYGEMIVARQRNAEHLWEQLAYLHNHQFLLPMVRANAQHAFMVFPIVLLNESKHDLMHYLANFGVEVRDLLPLTNQPCYSFDESQYPVSAMLNQNGFYIGCHQALTREQLNYTAHLILNYFQGKS